MFYIRVTFALLITMIYSVAVTIAIVIFGKGVFCTFAHSWAKVLLFFAGVKVNLKGAENIPMDRNIVIVSNHSSLFDIPILLSIFDKDVRIIYKKELEKIPFFGMCLKASPFIGIERQDPRKSLESINVAMKELNAGASIIVFPEGTRSLEGILGDFKRGAFVLAFKSGKELLPVALNGTHKIMQVGSKKFTSGTIDVTILPPMKVPTDMDKETQSRVIAEIKSQIQANLSF